VSVLLTWSLGHFIAALLACTEPRVAATHHGEFRELATRVMATEGADSTQLTTPDV